MYSSRTKKVTVYGRRAHRVVPVRDDHYFDNCGTSDVSRSLDGTPRSSAQQLGENPYDPAFNPNSTPSSKLDFTSQVKSSKRRKSVANLPKTTPLRKPLATFHTNIPRSPAIVPTTVKLAKKKRMSEQRKPIKSSYVDVDITIIDAKGRRISQEHRVTRKDITFIEPDLSYSEASKKPKKSPMKKSRRPRRTTSIPIYITTDSEDAKSDDGDDEYIPEETTEIHVRRTTSTHTAGSRTSKSKSASKAVVTVGKPPDVELSHKSKVKTHHVSPSGSGSNPKRSMLSATKNQNTKPKDTSHFPLKAYDQGTAKSLLRSDKQDKAIEIVLPKLYHTSKKQKKQEIVNKDARDVTMKDSKVKKADSLNSDTNFQPRRVTPIQTKPNIPVTSSVDHGSSKPRVSQLFTLTDDDISMDEELILALKIADIELASSSTSSSFPSEPQTVKRSKNSNNANLAHGKGNLAQNWKVTQKTPVPSYLRPILSECGQLNPFDFTSFIETIPADPVINFSDRTGFSENVTQGTANQFFQKVAEASYSEVFGIGNVVLKVIPLLDEENDVTDTWTADWESPSVSEANDVLREIQVTRAMGEICKGFNRLLKACIVQGPYPKSFLQLWDSYEHKKGSENVRPDHFSRLQTYAIIILPNSGPDLETFSFSALAQNKSSGWAQACSIFWQVAKTISRAEDLVHFEHRDLHWGQILVRHSSKLSRLHGYKIGGHVYMDDMVHGVQTTIIDLGLARIDHGGRGDNTVIWTPFTDDIFEGEGDYQYDVYRMMREGNGDEWESFNPLTNVIWLHYLTDKLLYQKQLRAPSRPRGRPSRMSLRPDGVKNEGAETETRAYDCLVEMERLLGLSVAPLARSVGARAKRKAKTNKDDNLSHVVPKDLNSAADVVKYGRERGWIL